MRGELREALNSKMCALADGDRTAFDFVFEQVFPIAQRFAIRLVVRNEDAQDIAQTVLSKVFMRASEYRRGEDALKWIFGITYYECRTLTQKVRRRKENLDLDVHTAENLLGTVESIFEQTELTLLLLELLPELGQLDRETIQAYLLEQERQVSNPTFRKRMQRATERLKGLWRRTYDLE